MAVSAIEKNRNNNSGNISYLKSIALGTLTGYSLKYILPITPQEKDEDYKASLNKIKTEAAQAKLNAIKSIKTSKNRALEEDVFIALYNKKKLNISEIKKLRNSNSGENKVLDLIKTINNEARVVFLKGKNALKASTKAIRPTRIFLTTGAAVGLAIAFTYNVINKVATDRAARNFEN